MTLGAAIGLKVSSRIYGYGVSSKGQQLRGDAVLVGCMETCLSQAKYGETKFQGRVLGLACYSGRMRKERRIQAELARGYSERAAAWLYIL